MNGWVGSWVFTLEFFLHPLGTYDICYPIPTEPNQSEAIHQSWEIPSEKCQVIRPGMVLLRGFLTEATQMAIIQTCRRLGMGPGGFYTPEYANGSRMKLRMMCLGRDWDPQARRYQEVRKDGAKTPSIPLEFHALVQAAVGAAQSLESVPVPSLTPDLCIVNFYESGGRLGLHQDKDESIETIN